MRHVVGLVVVAMLGSPLRGSAQNAETGAASEESLDEAALKLNDASLEVAPRGLPNEIEKLEAGIRRARIALGVSTVPIVVGGLLFGISYSSKKPIVCLLEPCPEEERESLRVPGAVVLLGGTTWMIVAGTVHSVRRRKLRQLKAARRATLRRVQWDLARSRLVF